MLSLTPSVQAPAAWWRGAPDETLRQRVTRSFLRSVVADPRYRWELSPVEIAMGLTADDVKFGPEPGDVARYGENAEPGTTDMTTALKRALKVAELGGGRMVLHNERYRITEGLVWTWNNHGLVIEGNGYDTQGGGSQIEYDGEEAGVLLHLKGASGVHPAVVRGVAFKNVSGHDDIAAVHLTGMRNCDISGNYFEGFERAIWTDMLVGYSSIQHASEFNYYVDNYFRANRHALYATKAGAHIVYFQRNRCHAQTGPTIFVEWSSDDILGETYIHQWIVRDNWFYDDSNPDPTLRFEGATKGLLIDGNYFEYNASENPKALIYVGAPGGQNAGVWITHNWMQGHPANPGGVIEVGTVDGLVVKGNVWTRGYGGSPPANAAWVRFLNANVTNYDIDYPALAFGAELPNTVRTSAGANIVDKHVDTYGYEGTWTPGVAFGGASTGVAYAVQSGRYRRQGRMVTVQFRVVLTNKGSATGPMTITGLPFATANQEVSWGASGAPSSAANFSGLTGALTLSGLVNSSAIAVQQIGPTGQASISDAQVTNTTVLHGTFTYMTD